ncbi:hypothetical protein B0H16DRAFT_1453449 [Mycena metata]|uniref:Uncharacterized protein n=1 Tax=Mycena metata TaxID=1033252 RepID=A0AAD7JR94_9AGAR|nr:hypothetical protein B0H16DRAFT_1453449 [Mycena metata]
MANGHLQKRTEGHQIVVVCIPKTDEDKREKRRKWAAEYRKCDWTFLQLFPPLKSRLTVTQAARGLLSRPNDGSAILPKRPDNRRHPHPHQTRPPMIHPTLAPSTPTPPISLTAAEIFALEILLELSQPAPPSSPEAARTPEPPDDEDRPVESGIDLPEQGSEDVDQSGGSSELVSFHSSLEALNQEPIHRRLGDWENAFAKELPFYARPASTAQKKIQRELGVIGPLTGTQQMQIAAAALGDPFDGDPSEPDPIVEPSLSQQRWDRILEWRRSKFDNKWDAATQRDFAEAALSLHSRR